MTQDFSSLRTTEDIINALSVLYFNLNEIERNYYDIFLNPEELTVQLQRYNDQGLLETIPVDNLAKLRTVAIVGSGNPNGQEIAVAGVGRFYLDTSSGALYYKKSGTDSYGWEILWSGANFVEDIDFLAPDGNASQLSNLNMDNAGTGTLSVSRGGTGANSITGLVKANGTAPMTSAVEGIDYLGASSTVGIICYYPVEPIPSGWLKCDGSAYDRVGTYARLFAKIGTAYNKAGDSDSIFRVPNLMNYDVNDNTTLPYYVRCWDGRTTLGASATQAAQVGQHNHELTGNVGMESEHVHDRGTMNITGKFSGVGDSTHQPTFEGSFYKANTSNFPAQGVILSNEGKKDDYFGFDASTSWEGVTSGPKTYNSDTSSYENGHTHSLEGVSTDNNTTDSTNENRVASMMMIPIIKY